MESAPGHFICGLRLSDGRMRRHGGRRVEQPGALPPTVAAAMVHLAGQPRGSLLDPCCGSGTILAEAVAAVWTACGSDLDEHAVRAATANVPMVDVRHGDARCLPVPTEGVAASVSNLPFGRQLRVQGRRSDWLHEVLGEMTRVTRPGGRIVLLTSDLPHAALLPQLRRVAHVRVTVRGLATAIWAHDRLG